MIPSICTLSRFAAAALMTVLRGGLDFLASSVVDVVVVDLVEPGVPRPSSLACLVVREGVPVVVWRLFTGLFLGVPCPLPGVFEGECAVSLMCSETRAICAPELRLRG